MPPRDDISYIPKRAYKQYDKKSGITLYRLMFQCGAAPTQQSVAAENTLTSYQLIFYVQQNLTQLIFSDFYHNGIDGFYVGAEEKCLNMMPVIKNGNFAGMVRYYIDYYRESGVRTGAQFFRIHDINKIKLVHCYTSFLDSAVSIRGTKPLIDTKDIFRYAIQNAFDGNPATSYVEDTEDDLFSIWLEFITIPVRVNEIAIINGYAENINLYRANNSAANCVITNWFDYGNNHHDWDYLEEFPLKSDLNYQILDIGKEITEEGYLEIIIDKIVKGTKYNDTCIAELNFKLEESGWLFDGMDDRE
jgi:hypothetical protein